MQLEREKARASLVQEFVRTGDPQKAAGNLSFLLDAGLLNDPDGKLAQALASSKSSIVLPSDPNASYEAVFGQAVRGLPRSSRWAPFSKAIGRYVTGNGGICTASVVASDLIITADGCADSNSADMDGALYFAFLPTGGVTVARLSEVVEKDSTLHYSLVRAELGSRGGRAAARFRQGT